MTLPALLKNKKFYLAIITVIVAVKAYNYITAEKPKETSNAIRVSIAAAARQDVPIQLELVGNVVAQETVSIKSRLDSQIINVLFKDGENVKEGQILFELDDRMLIAQQKEFEAALQKEKAQLVNMRLQYERAQKLLASKTVSQSRVDDARAAYQAQLAQVGAMQANLDSIQVQLSYTKITAPISGRAGTINVTRGNNVKANDAQALVTINQVSPIRVQFAIPQRYYDQVKTAMQATAVSVIATRSDAKDGIEGALEYVDNAIDAGNGTFAARAAFVNDDEKLWPGMFVKVMLLLGTRKDSLVIPAVAVQGDEGSRFVFKVDADNKKAVRTPLAVSQISGDTAIVESGLEEGEQVITDGLMRIIDGAAIDIAAPAPKTAAP